MLFPATTNTERPGKTARSRPSLPAPGEHHLRHFPSQDYSTVLNRPTLHEFLILWPPELLLHYSTETKQVLQSASAARGGSPRDPHISSAASVLHLMLTPALQPESRDPGTHGPSSSLPLPHPAASTSRRRRLRNHFPIAQKNCKIKAELLLLLYSR